MNQYSAINQYQYQNTVAPQYLYQENVGAYYMLPNPTTGLGPFWILKLMLS